MLVESLSLGKVYALAKNQIEATWPLLAYQAI